MPLSQLAPAPFTVKAEAADVATFQRATCARAPAAERGDARHDVPFTFPVRWLAQPEIRAAVSRLVGAAEGEDLLALHESQVFDYAMPLRADVEYRMDVAIGKESEPGRLILRAEVGPHDGEIHLRMEMILRIIAAGDTGHEHAGL